MKTDASLPTYAPAAQHWTLDPATVFLNHGSFGACPRPVLDTQHELRRQMERDPVEWMLTRERPLLDESRGRLARFVGCTPEDIAFVPNATIGVATVLNNVELHSGDELLVTTHEYPACLNQFDHLAERSGARVVRAAIPWPIRSPDDAVRAILDAVTDRTKLALVSHVTSPTGLVLPIERIVRELESRGVDTLVDGAHSVGFGALDLSSMRPAYFTSNCHKWLCTPKGCAVLYVREDRRDGFRPIALSNWATTPPVPGRTKLHQEFDYVGTDDHTAWLCVPAAIDCLGSLHADGFRGLMRRNRELMLEARRLICGRLGVEPPAPEEMIGCLSTIVLPPHDPALDKKLAARPSKSQDALQDALYERHRIQVPIWRVPERGWRMVRISAQIYNTLEQFEYLGEALAEELARERDLA